jgi:hypothetical protein
MEWDNIGMRVLSKELEGLDFLLNIFSILSSFGTDLFDSNRLPLYGGMCAINGSKRAYKSVRGYCSSHQDDNLPEPTTSSKRSSPRVRQTG